MIDIYMDSGKESGDQRIDELTICRWRVVFAQAIERAHDRDILAAVLRMMLATSDLLMASIKRQYAQDDKRRDELMELALVCAESLNEPIDDAMRRVGIDPVTWKGRS